MTRRTSAGRPGHALATTPHLPAVQFEHQPELRALMILPTLPPGHMTFPVEDDAFYPHLRRGEFAVVDLADHQPAQGELFLIAYSDPRVECGRSFALCQMVGRPRYRRPGGGWVQQPEAGADPATCWIARHWLPPADPRDREASLRSGRIGTSEGPFTTEYAAEKLVGRVVGVWVPGRVPPGPPST
jgi:hypothetical protein